MMWRTFRKVVAFVVRAILYVGGWIIELTQRLQDRMTHMMQKPEYVRAGACGSCGKCCHAVGIEVPRWMLRFPKCEQFFIWWHDLRYNFSYLGRHDNLLVYECRFINAHNKCSIYRWRPRLCREFPRAELFGAPRLHEGCGFYFIKRNASKFAQTLAKQRAKGYDE